MYDYEWELKLSDTANDDELLIPFGGEVGDILSGPAGMVLISLLNSISMGLASILTKILANEVASSDASSDEKDLAEMLITEQILPIMQSTVFSPYTLTNLIKSLQSSGYKLA